MTRTRSWGIFSGALAVLLLILPAANAASATQPTTTTSPTTTSTTRPADDPEVKQLWHDAVSALGSGQSEKALQLLDRLMVMNPDNVDYHLLDARALTLENKWKEANAQAKWVLDHAHQDFQKEWANFYHAQALGKAGDSTSARAIFKDLSINAKSAAVKALAGQAIDQLEP